MEFHLIDMDDNVIVYRDGNLVFDYHAPGDVAKILGLTGCPIHAWFTDEVRPFTAPETLAEILAQHPQAQWQTMPPTARTL